MDGDTALHMVTFDHMDEAFEIARLFLARSGINVNQPAVLGETALYSAVGAGNCRLVRLLLAHKAVPVDCGGVHDVTPLHKAERYGYREIAALLKIAGRTLSPAPARSQKAPDKIKSESTEGSKAGRSRGGKGGKDHKNSGKAKGKGRKT